MKKVLVVGAGVIGATSAFFLKQKGFEVTLIDELSKPAQYTSHANAGQLSYTYAFPWAYPGIAYKAAKWALRKSSPLRIKIDTQNFSTQLTWLKEMLLNANEQAYETNKKTMLGISGLSKKVLNEVLLEKVVKSSEFDWQNKGTLQLFRTKSQLKAAEKDATILSTAGLKCELLTDTSVLLQKEPSLAYSLNNKTVIGALHLPEDETGDCNLFTKKLVAILMKSGVNFVYNTKLSGLTAEGTGFVAALSTNLDGQPIGTVLEHFDAVLICAGVKSPGLLNLAQKDLDKNYLIYPVKGYSLTFESKRGPVSTVMDETNKIAITRLGSRVRMGGVAELNGFNEDLDAYRKNQFIDVFESLFGPNLDARNGQFWAGLRPATPSSVPFIEKVNTTGGSNLFINAGHGTLGWTMACGSAYLSAQQIEDSFSKDT